MGKNRPWSEEEIARLRKLRAEGVSAVRASVALKRPLHHLRVKAKEIGVPFPKAYELRQEQEQKERAARVKAGLPAEQVPIYGRKP